MHRSTRIASLALGPTAVLLTAAGVGAFVLLTPDGPPAPESPYPVATRGDAPLDRKASRRARSRLPTETADEEPRGPAEPTAPPRARAPRPKRAGPLPVVVPLLPPGGGRGADAPAQVDDGEVVLTDELGLIVERKSFKGGRLDGPYERYGNDGVVLVKGAYRDGKQHGTWTTLHPDGGRLVTHYVDGVKDGVEESSYADGKRKFGGTYRNGKMQGEWTAWHETGTVRAMRTYVDDRQHGITRIHYDDGAVENEYLFADGKLAGPSRGFYTNGQTEWVIEYKDGKRDGAAIWYDESGRLKAEGRYVAGDLNGRYTEYAPDGSVSKVEDWDHGARVKAPEPEPESEPTDPLR